MIFDILQLRIGDAAGGARADSLEHILHGEILAVQLAGHDRAAIEHQARYIEAKQRHRCSWNGLIASHQ
jgi:hypothetical protein